MTPSFLRLIVNADDLGAGTQRDRGIFHACRHGIVTSASLLANGPSFAAAARQARDLQLPVGVHLNLSEGPALTGIIPGLTDAAGHFLGKMAARAALATGSFDRARAGAELRAQVERVLAAGSVPDHLDTHQHFALLPPATPLVLETAEHFAIRHLRLPMPMEPRPDDPDGFLGEELALYRVLAPDLRTRLQEKKLHFPQGLWGMPCLDRLDEGALGRLLAKLPPGTWELMVHPGYADATAAAPFAGPAREMELAALLAPAVRDIVREKGIQLITFADLPCAS